MHRPKALTYTSKLIQQSSIFELHRPKMLVKKADDKLRSIKLET